MTHRSSRDPEPDELATARADLRDLQRRLAVVEHQQAFLLRAIDAKLIEIDRLEHLEEVGEAPRAKNGKPRGGRTPTLMSFEALR